MRYAQPSDVFVRLIWTLGFLARAMPASYRRTGNKNRAAPTWRSAAQIADGGIIGDPQLELADVRAQNLGGGDVRVDRGVICDGVSGAAIQAGITAARVRSVPAASVSAKISLPYSLMFNMVPLQSLEFMHLALGPTDDPGCDSRHRICDW